MLFVISADWTVHHKEISRFISTKFSILATWCLWEDNQWCLRQWRRQSKSVVCYRTIAIRRHHMETVNVCKRSLLLLSHNYDIKYPIELIDRILISFLFNLIFLQKQHTRFGSLLLHVRFYQGRLPRRFLQVPHGIREYMFQLQHSASANKALNHLSETWSRHT